MDLDQIPEIQAKVVSVIDREVTALSAKASLTSEEAKSLIAYSALLSTVYKEYRAEVLATKKEIKELSKEELQALIQAEVN